MPAEEGNFFTRKLGPLPLWAWAALAVALLGAYAYWKKIGPFAGASADSGSGYPTVDPSSLASMIGAGGSPNLGVVAGGGPADPGIPLGGGRDPVPQSPLPDGRPFGWLNRAGAGYGTPSGPTILPGASAGVR